MVIFEVDLRDRKTGNSIECICSTENHNEAYKIAEKYNKANILNYDVERNIEDYIDGMDGLIADVYHVEKEYLIRDVDKF